MADKKISALAGASTPLAGSEVLPIVQSGATVKVSVDNLTTGKDVTVKGLTATSTTDNNVTVRSTGTSNAASLILRSGNGTTSGLYSYARFINDNTAGQDWRFGIYGDSDIQLVNVTGSKNLMRWTTGGDVTAPAGNLAFGTAAKGVNFTANTPAAGMTSQLLNWYEEGTWTGTLTGGTTAPTTAVTATGNYTRIGNVVTISIIFVNKDTTGASGQMLVTGLPFTAKTGVNQIGSVASNGLSIPNKTLNTWISGGTTTIEFVSAADNGAWAFPDITAGAGKSLYITLSYHV